jgi:hypothetical protein
MQLQVLSEAFISTEKADPNAYLLPHLNLLRDCSRRCSNYSRDSCCSFKETSYFLCVASEQDSPFLKLNCLPKLLSHPMPLRRFLSRMEIRVDAVAELNSTLPRQLGTRKATESGHADQGGFCGRAEQHTAPLAKNKKSNRIWTC